MTYRENVDGMKQAINAKRAKYTKGERLRGKHHDIVIDLTEMPKPETGSRIRGGDRGINPNNNNNRILQAAVSNNSKPAFFTIPEDKGNGIGSDMEPDEYEKYDSQFDGAADQFLINSGATIIRSEITLTDSSGRNRVLVRRDDNNE